MLDDYGIQIDFAHRTFKWGSEASDKAAVHCVIVGFSAQYPESTLADMYGETSMLFHTALLNAHRELDKAVMKLYGFSVKDTDEAACVARLMELYRIMSGGK